jgi:hypothetical protein
MPGGLPRMQRQHQPPLRNLRSLRLLHHVSGLLQRSMHQREIGFTQLRRLRKRLPRIDAYLQSGRLCFDRVCRRSDILRWGLRQHEL